MKNKSVLPKLYFLKRNFFSEEYSFKYLLSILFNVYLLILIFDITRDSIAIPKVVNIIISAIRDGALYLLVIYILSTKKSCVISFFSIFYIGYTVIPLILNIENFFDNPYTEHLISTVFQFCILSLKPFLLLFILVNIKLFYVFEIKDIIKTFISIMTLLVLFSFLIFFFFHSLIIKYDIANRVGLGNMSIQAGMYVCAYILCLYYFPFRKKRMNYFSIFVLLLGIGMSVCSTGILAVIISIFLFLFDKKTRGKSLVILLSLILLLFM